LWRQIGPLQTTLVSKVGESRQHSTVDKAGIGPADNTRLKGRGKTAKAVLNEKADIGSGVETTHVSKVGGKQPKQSSVDNTRLEGSGKAAKAV
jgi:hypothetical protein